MTNVTEAADFIRIWEDNGEKILKSYETIANNISKLLQPQKDQTATSPEVNSTSGGMSTEGTSRDAIAAREQLVRDVMRYTYEPLTGADSCPGPQKAIEIAPAPGAGFVNLGKVLDDIREATEGARPLLVGAHYRSAITVKGRRSTFAINQADLLTRLSQLLSSEDYSALAQRTHGWPAFWEFWNAIFLDQYFALFGKSTTMNEWILERMANDEGPAGIYISFNNDGELDCCTDQSHGEWLKVALDEGTCSMLLDERAYGTFCSVVTRAVNQVATDQLDAVKGALQDSAERDTIWRWFDIMREANVIAAPIMRASGLRDYCDRQCDYVAMNLLRGRASFADAMMKHFRQTISDDDVFGSGRFVAFRSVVRLFQAMLMYARLFGDEFYTFPYKGTGGAPGCSFTLMFSRSVRLPEAERIKVMGWWKYLGEKIMTPIIEQSATWLREVRDQSSASGGFEPLPDALKNVWKGIAEGSGGVFQASSSLPLQVLLFLAEHSARATHEGQQLAFTFLLGSPRNLAHDLRVAHEFSLQRALRVGPDESDMKETIALINGNYSFLQSSNLALYMAYPMYPIEITHLVEIPGEVGGSRRQLVRSATSGRTDMIASVSYGNGSCDVIWNGKIVATYSAEAGWQPAVEFDKFWQGVESKILKVAPSVEPEAIKILKSVVERISDRPGLGAVLVLANRNGAKLVHERNVQMTQVFDLVDGRRVSEVGEELVFRLAIEDGATVIDLTSGQVTGRWLLRVTDSTRFPIPNRERKTEYARRWPEWYEALQWGTRHRAALSTSAELSEGEGVVLALSQDGPVRVFENGWEARNDADERIAYPQGAPAFRKE